VSTFALDLQKFADKAKARADEVVGRIVVNMSQRLDQRSPVGDAKFWKSPPPKGYVGGRFRGNWQIGVDFRPAGETGRIDPSGSAAQSAILAAIPEKASGKVYYLMNNVPYAQAIEEGHSRQAPQGLVGLTVIEFQNAVEQALAA
jgi:hypothetical protein